MFGPDNTLYVHLTLVPYIRAAREIETKPTQHSVKELREIGIQPDILSAELKCLSDKTKDISVLQRGHTRRHRSARCRQYLSSAGICPGGTG